MAVWYIGEILKSDFQVTSFCRTQTLKSAKQANSHLFSACGKYDVGIIYA